MIMGTYVLVIIYVGIIRKRNVESSEENFILSGRRLSITGFVATLVTTWYGAILGIGENTFLYGIQTWFIFSFPYYIFALAYAFWIAPKIRKSRSISIPDNFRDVYGERAGILSALILSFLASPAPYLLGMGFVIQFMFGLELGMALMISTIFSAIYVWNGGFGAVVRTDLIQFILMFAGFFILLGYLWHNVQSPILLIKDLPNSYLDPLGGNTLQYILAWFFLAAWTFIDPGFFQRCAAAKTPEMAQRGILISILFWAIFDCLTITCALYAVGTIQQGQAALTFPLLALDVLPIGVFGLFMTGIIATLMSTIDSLGLLSAISFGRDILWRIQSDNRTLDTVPFIRKGLVIISFLSLVLAYLLPSIVQLFYAIGSVLIPGLILPFLNTIRKHPLAMKGAQAVRWMGIPIIISMSWYIISTIKGTPFLGIEPFYPGILSSIGYFYLIQTRNENGS
jgi:SSS family solute:Na+ symporter